MYNEFNLGVDTSNPGGALRYREFENYIDKALSAFIEEGKTLKSVRMNERTGQRSVNYAYHGGKKIQDSVNAILNEMPAAMGYDLDSAGNVQGTGSPPPLSITQLGRHQYTEMRERVLDPRTLASIRAKILRSGGTSTVDKASGYTNMLIRGGLSGLPRSIQHLVDDTDRKYLDGELPSSALADGASPATIGERARAQVSRQAHIKDARRAAIEDYIKRNPRSQLAVDEAIKFQHVTNREEKARILKAERTPGTPEFKERVFRDLAGREARDTTVAEYLQKNPKSRLAKAAKAAKRAGTARKVGGAMFIADHIRRQILHNISSAVHMAVQVLTSIYKVVTSVGETIRKRNTDAMRYNLPTEEMKRLNQFAEGRTGLDSDVFAKVFGKIIGDFSDPTSFNARSVEFLAPLMRQDVRHLVGFLSSEADSPDTTAYAILDSVMRATREGYGAGISGMSPDRAYMINYGKLLEYNESLAALFERWVKDLDKYGGLYGDGAIHTSFDAYTRDARFAAATQPTGLTTPATEIGAEDTVDQWEELKAIWLGLKNDIFANILSKLSDAVMYLRNMSRMVMGKFAPEYAEAEERAAIASNQEIRNRVVYDLALMEPYAKEYAAAQGFGGEDGLERFLGILNKVRLGKDEAAMIETLRTNNMSADTYNTALSALSHYIEARDKLFEVDNAVVTEDSFIARQLGFSMKGQTLFVGGGTDAQRVASAYQISMAGLYGIREAARRVSEQEERMVDYGFDVMPGDLYMDIQRMDMEIGDMRRRGKSPIIIAPEKEKLELMERVYDAMVKDEANPLSLYQSVREAKLSESELDIFASALIPYDKEAAEDIARRIRGLTFAETIPDFGPSGNSAAAAMSRQNRTNSGLSLTGMAIREMARAEYNIPWEQLLNAIIHVTPNKDTERSLKVEIDLVDPSGNKNTIEFNAMNPGGYKFEGRTRLEGKSLIPGFEAQLEASNSTPP
jgi:hypothetical protein